METVIIRVEDKQDVRKLKQMSADNGWQIRSSGDMLRWLIDNAPQDVPLTDDDIMDEIRQVRQDINENQIANVFEFSESRGDPRGRPLNTIGASPAPTFSA